MSDTLEGHAARESRPAHLALVDTETGEVAGCPRCREVAVEDVAHLEGELRKAHRKIARLEADKQREREGDPQRHQIIELIERWKMATGHPRANAHTADRFDLIRARLREGYTVEDIELALDGLGHFRFVVDGRRSRKGQRHQRFDQLSNALSNGERLERMANLGHQARKERR